MFSSSLSALGEEDTGLIRTMMADLLKKEEFQNLWTQMTCGILTKNQRARPRPTRELTVDVCNDVDPQHEADNARALDMAVVSHGFSQMADALHLAVETFQRGSEFL